MNLQAEWLETDGLGGFASGTVGLARTRRYHGLLVAATAPPTGRSLLVAGFDAFLERDGSREALSSQRYGPDIRSPDGIARLEGFSWEPWPTWTFRLADGSRLVQEILATRGAPRIVVLWRIDHPGTARLIVRPFLAGRDYHALLSEAGDHPALRDPPQRAGRGLVFALPGALPSVAMLADAHYRHAPHWYRRFHLDAECARGFPHVEDLASPGELALDLGSGQAAWIVGVAGDGAAGGSEPAIAKALALRAAESERRARLGSPLERAADAYVVKRGEGETLIAGYPWFADWGRDTFIAMRGLCLATGRFDVARNILLAWSDGLVEGMLPNRFSDRSADAEYNAVDASLWFAVVVHELLGSAGSALAGRERSRLIDAVDAILRGYARGTRHRICVDGDGLLAAGEPGVQLTWMDARVGERVITPRVGKAVEVQALWWNALVGASQRDSRWRRLADHARASFLQRFWNEEQGFLYDVVDVDHVAGTADASLRPNQVFAIGGLPRALLEGPRARRVIDACERALWTPLGLRSLAPGNPAYVGRYAGPPERRDEVYHQGTVWPWLLGAFVEGWLRVRADDPGARQAARARFLAPLRQHLAEAGLGHVSEVADGDAPHTPGGCPFQAWSVGELLRLERAVLAESREAAAP